MLQWGIKKTKSMETDFRLTFKNAQPPTSGCGVMRGVCSRKVLREFESFVPVRAFAFPRPNATIPQYALKCIGKQHQPRAR